MSVIITPDELYDTYVEIDKDMLLDVKIYNPVVVVSNMITDDQRHQTSSSVIILGHVSFHCY